MKRIDNCRRLLYRIKGIGSKAVRTSPLTASKLYWSICVTKLTCGSEVMDVEGKMLDLVEMFHFHAAKNIQGLPDQASNAGSIATVGWKGIECHIDYMRLTFMW